MATSIQELKKLGFRPKQKSKQEWEVTAEVAPRNYISISIYFDQGEATFSGLEIEGDIANEVRKKMFSSFDFEEIEAFLQAY